LRYLDKVIFGVGLILCSCTFSDEQSCNGELQQDKLDVTFKEFYDAEKIPIFNPSDPENITFPLECNFLKPKDDAYQKVFKMFTFIDGERYILQACDFEKFTEITAYPKFLSSHVEEDNGECRPIFNPLKLDAYTIEFSRPNGVFNRLYKTGL